MSEVPELGGHLQGIYDCGCKISIRIQGEYKGNTRVHYHLRTQVGELFQSNSKQYCTHVHFYVFFLEQNCWSLQNILLND